MDGDAWGRIEELFFRALEMESSQRSAFLDQVSREDSALGAELDKLLAVHLRLKTVDATGRPDALRGPGDLTGGTRIGAYEIDILIGRGGMGEVYLADRADAQYEQRVAIKIMRPGRESAELVRRFKTERQILARLQHPHIATLLDGGLTEAGQPYLVMQYVDGETITDYAHRLGLSRVERVQLFLVVCEAVQFAHANLVVHRDLKPSNILVDRQGSVRLLDFGVAKLLDVPGWSGSATADLLMLTPEHAAPEQFLGTPVTTATDVYALGVLLYELLAGTRPFQFVPPIELHRAVCEGEPDAPSRAAEGRRADAGPPPVPASDIEGDLDAIVLKAIRKEPERRYPSVSDLAEDLRRYLSGFPVQARPDALSYVAGRFLRRHRGGVAAVLAIAAALTALTLVSVRSAALSREQTRLIAEERDVAVEVSGFLEDLFEAPDPLAVNAARRDTLRISALLDESATKVRDAFVDRPALQARLLTVLGRAYRSLGLSEQSLSVLEEALSAQRAGEDASDVDAAATERALGVTLGELGRNGEAEALLRSAALRLEADSIQHRDERIKTLGALANVLQAQGDYAGAEDTYRHSEMLAVAEFGPDAPEVAVQLSNLANALQARAKLDEAEAAARRSLAIQEAELGPEHPRVGASLNNLGSILLARRAYQEAEGIYARVLEIVRATLPTPHPVVATVLNNVAVTQLHLGRLEEAERNMREVLEMRRALFGNDHRSISESLINLGSVLKRQGRHDEALALDLEATERMVTALGSDHPAVATVHNNVGVSYHLAGRHEEALAIHETALRIRMDKLGPDHPSTANSHSKVAQCLLDLGRYQEAEAEFLEAFRGYEPVKADHLTQWNYVLEQMGILYRAMDNEPEAARFERMRIEAS